MTRILFVDGEPQLLEGLRDLLRRQRREWTMVFALGAEAALAELGAATFDVVVSDMHMPGMDGATLLGQVRERYPNVVRIVLSGQTSTESALRAVPVAHRFLAKPCQPSALVEAVASVGRAQAFVRDPAIRRLATAVGTLPSAFATHSVASVLRPAAGQRVNAIFVPSGDHAGSLQPSALGSAFAPPHADAGWTLTSCRPVPSACTIQIELCTSGVTCREKTISFPCGDQLPNELKLKPAGVISVSRPSAARRWPPF